MRADLNGDRRPERIRTAVSRGAPARCRVFLVVTSRSRTSFVALPSTLRVPKIYGVVNLGGNARRQILMILDTGAVSDGFGAFVLDRGKVRRLHIAVPGSRDVLYVGGSGPELLAAVCVDQDGRHVVASEALRNGTRYEVDRHIFRLVGDRLVQTSEQRLLNTDPKRFPEFQRAAREGFRGLTFSGCDLHLAPQ